MILFYIFILIIAFYILVRSGGALVSSLTFISRFFGISEYTASFVLMAMATSLPEFFVGISSAISGKPNISFGNIIGANIINVTLAIALVAIFARSIKITSEDTKHDSFLAVLLSLAPLLLIIDGVLSRWDGILLIVMFFGHLVHLIKKGRQTKDVFNSLSPQEKTLKIFFNNFGQFILGSVILLISSSVVVWSVNNLAAIFGLSLFIVGLVIVAIGTTLPEITFGIRSVVRGKDSMAFGNVFGSTATNSALILGTVSLISPIHINNFKIVSFSLLMMTVSLIVFALMVRYKKEITYKNGLALLFFYILFLGLEFLLK